MDGVSLFFQMKPDPAMNGYVVNLYHMNKP